MEGTIIDYPALDLSSLKIKKKDDIEAAETSIFAQINKWLENEKIRTSNLDSILLNKLVYYIAREVQKTNPDFILDTGWYIYGPCFENGRKFEIKRTPMMIEPIAKDVQNEVDIVCKELIPRFRKCQTDGTIMTDFLKYIYSEKCDKNDFREFYNYKQEIYLLLHRFNDIDHHNIGSEKPLEIHEILWNYEKIFYDSNYSSIVGLNSKEIESIKNYIELLGELIDFELDEQKTFSLIKDFATAYNEIILSGLSQFNYAKTFESYNENYRKTISDKHFKIGQELLKRLYEEKRWLSRELFYLIQKHEVTT